MTFCMGRLLLLLSESLGLIRITGCGLRHCGDFSIFRIYASKDGKPANYAADNVPFESKEAPCYQYEWY